MPSKQSKPRKTLPSQKREEFEFSEEELRKFGKEFAQKLKPGDRLLLNGPLGAGKTTFAKILLDELEVDRPSEGSPSFPIALRYESKIGTIIHLDFYRIETEIEAESAGLIEDLWSEDATVITEWLSKFQALEEELPKHFAIRVIDFEMTEDPERRRLRCRS